MLDAKKILALAVLLTSTLACKPPAAPTKKASASPSPTPSLSSDTNSSVAAIGCTAANCPQATIEWTVGGVAMTTLTANLNTPVNWTFAARASNDTRNITVFDITSSNANIIVSGKGSASPAIQWTPSSADAATPSGSLQVTARDMTRCTTLSTNQSECSNYATPTSYDVPQTFNYTISNNGTALNPGSSGTGMMGGLLKMLPTLMSAFSGGGDMSTIMQSMTGLLGGTGGLQTQTNIGTTPTTNQNTTNGVYPGTN